MKSSKSGDELHNVLLNELRRTATATTLEPTLILERDSLGAALVPRFFLFCLHRLTLCTRAVALDQAAPLG